MRESYHIKMKIFQRAGYAPDSRLGAVQVNTSQNVRYIQVPPLFTSNNIAHFLLIF